MANEHSGGSGALRAREKEAVGREGTRPGLVFRPDVDILELPDGFVIYADLPGVDQQSVEVHLEKGVLAIDAHLATGPDPSWRPVHVEYRLGAFHREFRVSEEIDVGGVSARMRDGVLELRLPKRAQERPRTIPVRG